MKTKAELEEELRVLQVRVAELEGAVAAYRFALEQAGKPETPIIPNSQDFWTWPYTGQPVWYPPNATVPQITYSTNNNTE